MEEVEEPRPEPEQTLPKPSAKRQKTKSSRKVKDPEAELEQAQRLAHLSRAPGKCPLGTCDQMVFPSSLMVHLLHKHSRDPRCTVATIYTNKPLRLSVDPRSLTAGVPQCLAILLYAGADGKQQTEPGRRLISFPNAGLLNERRPLEYHLSLAVMICKTTFYALLADKELEKDLASLNPTTSGLFVIWVVSPITTQRIYYTLTAFDRYYMQSRSVIRRVRNYSHSQNPSEFLPSETDYLLLRESEAMTMLNGRHFFGCHPCFDGQYPIDMGAQSPGFQLELIVHDHPTTSSMEERTSSQLFETYSGPATNMPRSKYQLFRGVNGKLSLGRKPLPADKDRSRESAQRIGKHEEQCTGKRTKEGGDERIMITGTISKPHHHKKRKERSKGGLEKSAKKGHEDIIPAKSNLTFVSKRRGAEGGNALASFRDLPLLDPKSSEDSDIIPAKSNVTFVIKRRGAEGRNALPSFRDLPRQDLRPSEDSKFLAHYRNDSLAGSSDLPPLDSKASEDSDIIPAKSNVTFVIKRRGAEGSNALASFRDSPPLDPKTSEDSDIIPAKSNLTFVIKRSGAEGSNALASFSDSPPLDPKASEDSEFLAYSRNDSPRGSSDFSLKAFKGSSEPDTNDGNKKYSEEGYQVNYLEDLLKSSGFQVPGETVATDPLGYKNSSEESLPEKYSKRRQVQMKDRSGSLLSSLVNSSNSSKMWSPVPAPVPAPVPVTVQFSDPFLLITHNEDTKKNSQLTKKSESSEESLPEKYTRYYQKNLKPRSYPQELKADNQCPSKDEIHKSSNDDMIRDRRPHRSSRQLDEIFLQKEREWESARLKGAGFLVEPVRSPQSLSQKVIESQNATAMESAIKPVSCPLEKVREAVMRSVKDSLLMADKETILQDVELPSMSSSEPEIEESEVDIIPETDPAIAEPKEEKQTASDSNLPIPTELVLTLEETFGSDWEQP